MDISITLAILFGVANIIDRHFIAKRTERQALAFAKEREHLIHLIAAKNPADVVTLERSTKPPVPKDPEHPSFRMNPIS